MAKALKKMNVGELVEYGMEMDPPCVFEGEDTKAEMVAKIEARIESDNDDSAPDEENADDDTPPDENILGEGTPLPAKDVLGEEVLALIQMTEPQTGAGRTYLTKGEVKFRAKINEGLRRIFDAL